MFKVFINLNCLSIAILFFINIICANSGWGNTHTGKPSPILQQVQLTVVANNRCKEVYARAGAFRSNEQFTDTVLCAGQYIGQAAGSGITKIPNLPKNAAI